MDVIDIKDESIYIKDESINIKDESLNTKKYTTDISSIDSKKINNKNNITNIHKKIIDNKESLNNIPNKSINIKKEYIIRIIYISDLKGSIYSKPIPDNITRNGEGIINTMNPKDAPTSNSTSDKYLLKGGLARIQTRIKEIIKYTKYNDIMMITGGSMIHGSEETFFSQGQIMVKALMEMGTKDNRIQYHAPGKYDYTYGFDVFTHTFNNLYNIDESIDNLSNTCWLDLCIQNEIMCYPGKSLALNLEKIINSYITIPILLNYDIKEYTVNNTIIKIGIIGLTTDQIPIEMSKLFINNTNDVCNDINDDTCDNINVKNNYIIHGHVNKPEIKQKCIDDKLISLIKKLKYIHRCKSILLISNFGINGNERLAEMEQLADTPIDIIFSSGSNEKKSFKTRKNKTLIIESGMYGECIGNIKLPFIINNKGKIKLNRSKISGNNIEVGPYIKEDKNMNNIINILMNTYYPPGSRLQYPYTNIKFSKISKHLLNDNIILRDKIFPTKSMCEHNAGNLIYNIRQGLHRCNYSNHPYFPAFMEGTSSNLIAECIRNFAKCQIGIIRGYTQTMIIESHNNISIDNINNVLSYGYMKTGYGNGNLSKSDFYQSLPMISYIGRGYILGEKLYNVIKNSLFMELNGNIYNNTGNYMIGFSGCKIELCLNNLQSLMNGILRGPSDVIIKSIKILSSFDKNPFDISNYKDLIYDEYYSISGETDISDIIIQNNNINYIGTNRINNIILDAFNINNNIRIPPIINNNIKDKELGDVLILDINEYTNDTSCPIHIQLACIKYIESLSINDRTILIDNITHIKNIKYGNCDIKLGKKDTINRYRNYNL